MRINPAGFFLIPDRFKTQEMCIEGVEVNPWQLHYVPGPFKTQEMCDKAVREDPSSLEYVPDWFVTQGQAKIWDDDDDYATIRNLLSGTMVIKKGRPRKHKLRKNFCPLLGILIV